MEEILKRIVSLSRSERAKLTYHMRTNTLVWNAIHGIGEIIPELPDGKIEGLVNNGNTLQQGVLVKAEKLIEKTGDVVKGETEPGKSLNLDVNGKEPGEGEVYNAETNENGFYRLYLPPGKYRISFEKEGFEIVKAEKIFSVTDFTDVLNAELPVRIV